MSRRIFPSAESMVLVFWSGSRLCFQASEGVKMCGFFFQPEAFVPSLDRIGWLRYLGLGLSKGIRYLLLAYLNIMMRNMNEPFFLHLDSSSSSHYDLLLLLVNTRFSLGKSYTVGHSASRLNSGRQPTNKSSLKNLKKEASMMHHRSFHVNVSVAQSQTEFLQ